MSTNKNLLVAAVVTATAAASAIVLYILTRPPQKVAKPSKVGETKLNKFDREITKEQLVKVLQEITVGVQQVIMALAQEEQSIVNNPNASSLSPQDLQRHLLTRFQEGVADIEANVYKKHGIKENQVKLATEKFEADADVKKAVQQLKSVYGAVMGGNPQDLPPVPDFLTKDKVLEVLDDTMKILREEAKETVEILKGKNITKEKDAKTFQVEFQKMYGVRVEKSRRALYTKNEIHDDLIIQSAVVKYQNDISFQQRLKQSSESHNAEMAKLGFVPQGPPK